MACGHLFSGVDRWAIHSESCQNSSMSLVEICGCRQISAGWRDDGEHQEHCEHHELGFSVTGSSQLWAADVLRIHQQRMGAV
jgi:hypothetical protein